MIPGAPSSESVRYGAGAMKQKQKKLTVNRETVRQLDVGELRRVQGGESEATCVTRFVESEATCVTTIKPG